MTLVLVGCTLGFFGVRNRDATQSFVSHVRVSGYCVPDMFTVDGALSWQSGSVATEAASGDKCLCRYSCVCGLILDNKKKHYVK